MAASMSASEKMMFGDLPPSSSETFFRLPVAAVAISLPTSVEPVKAILSTPMRREGGASGLPEPGDDVDDPVREAGLEHELTQPQGRELRLLGRLEDHRATRGQCRPASTPPSAAGSSRG